jgi:hypothetical protein
MYWQEINSRTKIKLTPLYRVNESFSFARMRKYVGLIFVWLTFLPINLCNRSHNL